MIIALYIIVGLVVLIGILALAAPKTFAVSRSIEIAKDKSEVFEYIRFLKKQDEWSPWQKKDPNMEKEFAGTDGEVGAISRWKGNKEVGEGEQEITKVIGGERIESRLRFFKPWKSESDAFIAVAGSGDGSKVTWGFSGNNKFPFSIMTLFISMDKMMGKDFENGLKSLKENLEK